MESESEQQATRRPVVAATGVCRSILDGATTPYDGARQIAAMCRETAIHPPVELHTFVYADSEWDERPEDGNIFAEGVVAAARDLARADQER